jgi:hypothetical protein
MSWNYDADGRWRTTLMRHDAVAITGEVWTEDERVLWRVLGEGRQWGNVRRALDVHTAKQRAILKMERLHTVYTTRKFPPKGSA